MRKSLTQQLIHALITVIIVYSITAIVPRLISSYLTTYFYLLVLVACLLLVLVSRGRKSVDEYVILIIPFIIWKLLVYLITRPSLIDLGYNILLDFSPIILGLYITKRLDYSSKKYFSIIIIVAIAITLLTSYIGLQQYPDASRYLATVADASESRNVKYNMMNIGGYEFVYTTVLLYPLLIYAYKQGKIKFFWTIVIAIIELVFIIQTSYTTALILWMLSTMFFFFNKDFKSKNLIYVGIIAVLLFFVLWDLFSSWIDLLADNIASKDISERLHALAGGQIGLENSEDNRLELYLRSINTFLAHPIIGSLTSGGGGHSSILDTLARYGLMGAVIFIVLYTVIFKKFFMPYRNTKGYGYIVWIFVQTLILSTVNTGMWLYVLCLYTPVLLAFLNNGAKNNENIMDSKHGIAYNR